MFYFFVLHIIPSCQNLLVVCSLCNSNPDSLVCDVMQHIMQAEANVASSC